LKLLVFSARFLGLILISFLTAFFLFLFLRHAISPFVIENPLVMLSVGVLVALVCKKPLDRAIGRGLQKLGLEAENDEDYSKLTTVVHSLLFETELAPACHMLLSTLTEELGLKNVSLFVQKGDVFEPAAFQGYAAGAFKGFRLSEKSPLIEALKHRPDGLKGLGPKEPMPQEMNSLSGELHRLKTSYIFPLSAEHQLFAFLSLGFKDTGVPHKDEIRHLQGLLSTLSAAIYSAREMDQIKHRLKNIPEIQADVFQKAKYSALEQLATGIAHEIHNPLTIMSGKAQVLLLKKSKSFNKKKVEDVLKTIVDQTKRASEVTRKLLVFTKTSSKEREDIDLEVVLKDTLSLISYQMSLDQLNLVKAIDPNLPKYLGNQMEVREIFMTLILNAIQATPSKGEIQISLRLKSVGNVFEFCVQDSGAGISKEELEKIFDPFYTSTHESLGLGLYIAERLVYKHGGRIQAESEEGRGSLFMVELPHKVVDNYVPDKPLTEVAE
jgi:signal transduction histidine kinase